MASIKLEKVTKKFKNTIAVNEIDLQIEDGEFFCILGPPGAGKTTILRMIMGLETPDQGNIIVDGEAVTGVHPSKRDIAMIFQNLALYPDKTVFDNIAFPLRQQRVEEGKIRERVKKVAEDLHIDWLLEKIPSQLSGGERQRVAIGRAIVRQPKAYLMDEPLSNLDALLRLEMRVSLKELQASLKETFVYVTHDQVEALSMGDRIAVVHQGVLQQIGDPETIYQQPNNVFVATILGSPPMNFLKCAMKHEDRSIRIEHGAFSIETGEKEFVRALKSASVSESVVMGLRPEDVIIQREKGQAQGKPAQDIPAEIYVIEPLGNETIVDLALGDNVIKVLAEPDFEGRSGQKVWITIDSAKLHLFHEETHECIYHASKKDDIKVFLK
jgi:multiple sugar transport system ATP-binding protein